ncbi:hypothetical protein DL764_004213 [Monosporascus ibericus]|uniref:Uncharacterized protein n=1 Tax=Monosporascus ibericus TaxID=155417 RepID=A0A4Q4TH14_9PEZI|nr:hypothetical protein DL764_004213 [Monosporascus ibericus]
MADSDDKTPLSWAADKGHHAVIKHLIGVKADVNAKTVVGWTPLHYATQSASETIIKCLLPYADANAVAKDGTTPLVAASKRGNVDMVRRLLDVGYDINRRDMRRWTQLHWVTKSGPDRLAVAKALLSSDPKPDLGIENVNGLTPLRLEVWEKQLDLVELLLESEARLTRNVGTKDWLRVYSHVSDPSPIIEVEERVGEGTKVVCLSAKDFSEDQRRFPTSTSSVSRRLLIFTEPLKELPTIPNSPPLPDSEPSQHMMPYLHRQSLLSGGVHFTFAVYFPSFSQLTSTTMRRTTEGSMMMIRWIVAKQPYAGSRTGESWKSVNHFSTLPNGLIPDDGVDFFTQFLDQLRTRWIRSCEDGEELLADSEAVLNGLPGIIREFADLIGARLEGLNAKSQDLIQTEFNVTSIAEAKHSTSTNNSMNA